MLTKILMTLGNVLLNFLWGKAVIWWAQHRAKYYKKMAELEKKRQESLKEGKATEEVIRKSGDTAVLHADKVKKYEDKVAVMEERAAEWARKANGDAPK